MSKWVALLKMNMKLLFRNKGFLFFLCVTPVVSVAILNLKVETELNNSVQTGIIELEKSSNKAVYNGNTFAYIIKVYDGSGTELSDYLLERLAAMGLFSVCRYDVRGLTGEEVEQQAKKDAFDDRVGTLLYIKKDFEKDILLGNYQSAIQVYSVSDDERWELFELELTEALSQIHSVAEFTGADSGKIVEILGQIEDGIPQKSIVNLTGKKEIALTDKKKNQKSLIGYAFAIITLGFLFCGVFVAHTVIEEQNNKVYTRMMLSKFTKVEYFCFKFLVTFVISIVQTLILGLCIFSIKNMDFGINMYVFLFIILCLGLIFSTISFLLGTLLGEVMSANYAVFTVWSISALLSGLYFPLDATSAVIKTVSYLMPQRWFMRATELLLAGDKGAYSMVLYITMAYLIVSVSVGSIGLKMKGNRM
ncbi:MAG: ABC transporter permease [Lachnospiraceae bacterium]|nr:ABC transporter permease [Lachnospiraceae bacterium]